MAICCDLLEEIKRTSEKLSLYLLIIDLAPLAPNFGGKPIQSSPILGDFLKGYRFVTERNPLGHKGVLKYLFILLRQPLTGCLKSQKKSDR